MSTVAILGASNNPERYSYKAQTLLKEYGHTPLPVSLHDERILGEPAVRQLSDITAEVDTLTVYINPAHLREVAAQIETLQPRRVIFNPGSEDPATMERLRSRGIEVEEACTLVLLRTEQF